MDEPQDLGGKQLSLIIDDEGAVMHVPGGEPVRCHPDTPIADVFRELLAKLGLSLEDVEAPEGVEDQAAFWRGVARMTSVIDIRKNKGTERSHRGRASAWRGPWRAY